MILALPPSQVHYWYQLASSPGPTQILSHSRGDKIWVGLVDEARYQYQMKPTVLFLLYNCCFILLWLPSVLHELSIDTGGIDKVLYHPTLAIQYV